MWSELMSSSDDRPKGYKKEYLTTIILYHRIVWYSDVNNFYQAGGKIEFKIGTTWISVQKIHSF